jgi:multidrug resistance efflux pump
MKPIRPQPVPATPRLLRWFWVLGIVLLAGSLLGARLFLGGSSNSKAAVQEESTVPSRVICFGHVEPRDGVLSLSPPFAGRVLKVIKEGETPVEKDAELIVLDAADAQNQLKAANADLEAAKFTEKMAQQAEEQYPALIEQQEQVVNVAKSKLAAATAQQKRAQKLFKDEQIKQEELDVANAAVSGAQAEVTGQENKLTSMKNIDPTKLPIERAKQDVTAKQAQRDRAEKALKEHTLRAPSKGTVLQVRVSEGGWYSPMTPTPAVIFCPDGPRIIRCEVEQEFASRVKVGQEVCLQDDSNGQGRWTGKVTRVGDWFSNRRSILPEPVQFHDVRTLECIVEEIKPVRDNDIPLRINQRMRVTIFPDGIPDGECK